MKKCYHLAGLAAIAASVPASAEVAINEHLSVSGYAVGAVTNLDVDGAPDVDTAFDSGASNLDSVKVAFTGNYESLSGTVSLFFVPDAPKEAGILDAYATYDFGGGLSVTGGKYLSYLGYEAFDPVNMTQLTYAVISGIPGYHSGVKVDYSTDAFALGFSATDSVYSGPGFFEGDKEFSDDVGFEAIFVYKGIEKLTVFTGIAFEDTDGAPNEVFVFDLWASYALSDTVTIAGEFVINDDVAESWLAFLQYTFTEDFSTIFRISGQTPDVGPDLLYYTVAPTYVLTENFSVRAELSYLDSDGGGDSTFYGVQGVFKF